MGVSLEHYRIAIGCFYSVNLKSKRTSEISNKKEQYGPSDGKCNGTFIKLLLLLLLALSLVVLYYVKSCPPGPQLKSDKNICGSVLNAMVFFLFAFGPFSCC